jgi:hypothetical protein
MDPNKQLSDNDPSTGRGSAVPSRIRMQPLEDRPQVNAAQPTPAAEQSQPEQTASADTELAQPEQVAQSQDVPPPAPSETATNFVPETPVEASAPLTPEVAESTVPATSFEPSPVASPLNESVPLEAAVTEPAAAEPELPMDPALTPRIVEASSPSDAPTSWEQNPIATPAAVILPQDVKLSTPDQPLPVQPIVEAESAPTAFAPVISSGETVQAKPPVVRSKNPLKRLPKRAIVALGILLVLTIGCLAFYFGFYANSSLLYKQALSNSGVAYNALIDYAKGQSSTAAASSATIAGSYSFKSTAVNVDGKINSKGDTKNSELTFDVGILGNRVNFDVRTLKAPTGTTPDVYVKADGITGFGELLTGSAQAGAKVDALNGKWIAVDHSYIDSLQQSSPVAVSPVIAAPTKAQVYDEATAIGKVNKEYLFSTDKNKAVTTVLKTYGMETIDGHKLYHYKVGFVKANVKKYVIAQKDALKASSLSTWIAANNYQAQVDTAFAQIADSTDKISASDSVDLWADLNSRTIYKTRVVDPTAATSYVEAGLNFKRGDKTFKYFLNGVSSSARFALNLDLDSVTNSATFAINGTIGSGASAGKLAANFTFKPTTEKFVIEKPTVSYTAAQVMALYQALAAQSAAASSTVGSSSNSFSSTSEPAAPAQHNATPARTQ